MMVSSHVAARHAARTATRRTIARQTRREALHVAAELDIIAITALEIDPA